jgi:DNA polymerase I-like protein with 3'-5' exonuclease and polymerase domains
MAKLNVQGLSRKEKILMECIEFEKDYVGVSIDLSSGEPTVTSHFSQDPNYRYACFDGVGKEPFYREDTLMIDDIYLMTMSRSPIGKGLILDAFNNTYGGLSFVETWMQDPEIIKGLLKKDRQIHKMLALALGYGMGPKKMVKQCYDSGHTLSFKDAKEFYRVYWDLFKEVRNLEQKLSRAVKNRGWIVNPFGYRLKPEEHKAFNYFIQSSVSGIMHLFGVYLFREASYARFITCIHDEFLVEIPKEKIETFRRDKERATELLNERLKWSVNVRTGFEIGNNWYEAK